MMENYCIGYNITDGIEKPDCFAKNAINCQQTDLQYP